MNKFFISFLFVSLFASLVLEAAVYKGQIVYAKKCAMCHKNGQIFVATKMAREWNDIMVNNGKKLADIHLQSKSADAAPSHEYFMGEVFFKTAQDLKDFVVEYAKDSGKVPACN